MALILKKGAIFLHIPKTGGKWVSKVLKECGLVSGGVAPKHLDYEGVVRVLKAKRRGVRGFLRRASGPSIEARPFMFCFVRHPLSRLCLCAQLVSKPGKTPSTNSVRGRSRYRSCRPTAPCGVWRKVPELVRNAG
jgi:hypothetical protein